MKKLVSLIIAVIMIFSVTLCYASEDVGDTNTNSDDVTDIDNFDDFNSVSNGGYTQGELQGYYEEYIKMMEDYYENYERSHTVKARVISAGDLQTIYNMDYYNVYQIRYQSLEIEILEGEYKGKILNTDYILTGDTFGNIQIPEVKEGDKILVAIETDENGELNAYTVSFDTSVSRSAWIIGIAIVTLIIVLIYAGVKGVQSSLLVALTITLLLVITIPELLQGTNIWLLGVIDAILLAFVTLVNKMGLKKNMFCAFGVTLLIIAFAGLLTFGIDAVILQSGYSMEISALADSMVNKNIDFHGLYIVTILVITSVLVSEMMAKAFEISNYESDWKNIIQEMKAVLASKINIIAIFTITFLMPKLLVFMGAYKYTLHEILNSEMFLVEIVRMMILLIVVSLTVPASALFAKKINTSHKLLEKETNVEDLKDTNE